MSKTIAAAILLAAAQRSLGQLSGPGSKLDNTDIAKAIVDGSQIARDKIMYIRSAQSEVSGRQQILNEAVAKKQGETNFDNGALPKNRAFVVTHVRIASMANASLTGAAYNPVISAAPIANGELYIENSSGKSLLQGPIGPMLPPAAPTKNEDSWYELPNPILLQAGETVKVDAFFAGATALNTNIEVAFKGVENQAR